MRRLAGLLILLRSLSVVAVVATIALVIAGCGDKPTESDSLPLSEAEAPELTEEEFAKKRKAILTDFATRHGARIDWIAQLEKVGLSLLYTEDVRKALVEDRGKPVAFLAFVVDVRRSDDQFVARLDWVHREPDPSGSQFLASLQDEDDLPLLPPSTTWMTERITFDLVVTPAIAEVLLQYPRGHSDHWLVVAEATAVRKTPLSAVVVSIDGIQVEGAQMIE
ncbi:hypothetical protein HQ560_11805, partial [bacterium]|nr:hypothetical protein [bacterium]